MEVRTNEMLGGYGLYATKNYAKGELIFVLSGQEFSEPTKYTIYVGNNVHIHDEYGIYMNHSFAPSTIIRGRNVVALVDIRSGDELTFDYNASEPVMASPFLSDGKLVNGNNSNL